MSGEEEVRRRRCSACKCTGRHGEQRLEDLHKKRGETVMQQCASSSHINVSTLVLPAFIQNNKGAPPRRGHDLHSGSPEVNHNLE